MYILDKNGAMYKRTQLIPFHILQHGLCICALEMSCAAILQTEKISAHVWQDPLRVQDNVLLSTWTPNFPGSLTFSTYLLQRSSFFLIPKNLANQSYDNFGQSA